MTPASFARSESARSSACAGSGSTTCKPDAAGAISIPASSRISSIEPRLALGVDRLHARAVADVVAVVDELGENRLLERRRLAVGDGLGRDERVDQRRRRDQIADAQPGKRRGAERAGPDHAVAAVERAQRLGDAARRSGRRRRTRPRRSTRRPRRPSAAAPRGARATSSRRAATGARSSRARAARAARARARARRRCPSSSTGTGTIVTPAPMNVGAHVARRRLFDPHLVARVEREPAHQVERLLRAADDDDLLVAARDPACASAARRRSPRAAGGSRPDRRSSPDPRAAGASAATRCATTSRTESARGPGSRAGTAAGVSRADGRRC